MTYRFYMTEHAEDDLRQLDRSIARRIRDKLAWYERQGDPLSFAKPLRGSILGSYRFRVGDWRIFVDVDGRGHITVLMVLAIEHRSRAYKRG